MAKALTTYSVDQAKPQLARAEIPDGRVAGLYLVVQPSGKKSWAVRFRLDGKSRKHTLGPYPAIDLAKARKLAAKALEAKDEGRDPTLERRRLRDAEARARAEEARGHRNLFENIAREFIERYAKPRALTKNRPEAWKETGRILGLREDDNGKIVEIGGDVIPRWRGRKIQDLTKRDVIELLDAIVDRGSPTMANRTLAAVRKLCNWCVTRDILSVSPCVGVVPPSSERSRDRVLSDVEINMVWKASDRESWPYGAIIKLLALTGQRLSEVAEMRWKELDLNAALWTLPGERVKNGIEHQVPLSSPAVAILKSLTRVGESDWVFTLDGNTPVTAFSRAKTRLDVAIASSLAKDEELPEHWTFHDLRRTAASGMARLGIQLPVIEKVLNHSSGTFRGVVGVYQRHTYADEKRHALNAWASHIVAIQAGEPASNIFALNRLAR